MQHEYEVHVHLCNFQTLIKKIISITRLKYLKVIHFDNSPLQEHFWKAGSTGMTIHRESIEISLSMSNHVFRGKTTISESP